MARGRGPDDGDERDGDAPEGAGRVRLDKWLWAARFYKTRSLAAEAIEGGKVSVNGDRAKRAKLVQAGDEVRIRQGPYEHHLRVRGVAERRGPASEAQKLYEETPEGRQRREAVATQMKAMATTYSWDTGRPTKKDRREIQRFRERGGDDAPDEA